MTGRKIRENTVQVMKVNYCVRGYFSALTSYKFLALILFSVFALSMQLPQLFGTPFPTQSVLPIHSTFLAPP